MDEGLDLDWGALESALRRYWGYSAFRSPQREVIQQLMRGQDALVVLPTGMGKSICFQLPALLQTGLTVVVSPLIALMENQVQELQTKGLAAACLHSQGSPQAKRQILSRLDRQDLRLLYLSPETLLSPPIWERLSNPHLQIQSLIVDEAHCLVEWGDSFRPVYQRLGAVRPALLQQRPQGCSFAIATFTATADPQTQQTIQRILQLDRPQIIRQSPYRPNLNLTVRTTCSPRHRRNQVLSWIQRFPQQSGLVYVRSRRQTEALATDLQAGGIRAMAYHAGLGSAPRRRIEQAWLTGECQVVVCTSAFGLGINKPDCRFVVHYQPPLYLSEYLQEIGRAGRDGQPAATLLLKSEPTGWLDPSDQQQRRFLLRQLRTSHRQAQVYLSRLPPEGRIDQLKAESPDLELELAIAILHRTGHIQWVDPFQFRVLHRQGLPLAGPGGNWQDQALQSMEQFLRTSACRWQFLRHAFGEEIANRSFFCGHCDNCQHKFKKH